MFIHTQSCSSQSQHPDVNSQTANEIRELFDLFGRTCEVEYFHEGKISNDALISFAILHRNNLNSQVDSTGQDHVPARYVDSVVRYYFDKAVNHHSIDGVSYRNGYYLSYGSDAGEEQRIELSNVAEVGHDRYAAYANWYNTETNERESQEKMLLKKVSSGGTTHFVVVEYLKEQ